jgi:hypothetical protein
MAGSSRVSRDVGERARVGYHATIGRDFIAAIPDGHD